MDNSFLGSLILIFSVFFPEPFFLELYKNIIALHTGRGVNKKQKPAIKFYFRSDLSSFRHMEVRIWGKPDISWF